MNTKRANRPHILRTFDTVRVTARALVAFVLIFSSLLLPLPAEAGQLGERQLTMDNSAPGEYGIGAEGPGGGLIFHRDGDTYYEAAPEGWDGGNDPSPQWGCRGQSVPGTDAAAIGDGADNTAAIVAFHDDSANFNGEDYYTYSGDYGDIGCHSNNNGEVAAKYVDDLSLNGHTDWFLPSLFELYAMYENLHLHNRGGFEAFGYWGSSESSASFVWRQDFVSGGLDNDVKDSTSRRIRPARTFTHQTDSTTHQFNFQIATSASVSAFRFEYCSNDPFPGDDCVAPAMDASGFSVESQSGASGFSKDAAASSPNQIVVTNSGSQSFSANDPVSFEFGDIINPAEANEEFFVRIYTYDGDDITSASVIDSGGIASATGDAVDVTARVQETIQFCVYTDSCGASGTEANLGILNTTTTETTLSYFEIGTNARHGVTIQYLGTTLSSGSESIDPFNGGDGNPAASANGSEQFGLQVSSVSTGSQVAEAAAPFDTMGSNEYAFLDGDYQEVGTSNGPVEETTFTIEYAGNVAALTPTGVYTTQIEYIATGQF